MVSYREMEGEDMIVTVHSHSISAPYEYTIDTVEDLKNLLYKHDGKVTIESEDILKHMMEMINQ